MDPLTVITTGAGLFGSSHYGPTSDPRAAGLSLIGPQSGYPKIWVNNTMNNITIGDGQNMYTVLPGGRIQQGNGTLTGILIPIAGGSYPVSNANQVTGTNADPWPQPTSNTGYTAPNSLQNAATNSANAAGEVTAKADSTMLILGLVIFYFVAKS